MTHTFPIGPLAALISEGDGMFVTGLFGCSLPALAPDHHHLLPNRRAGYSENMNYTPAATTAESSASSSGILPPFFAASNSALSSFSDALSAKGSADIDASQKASKRRHDELDEVRKIS